MKSFEPAGTKCNIANAASQPEVVTAVNSAEATASVLLEMAIEVQTRLSSVMNDRCDESDTNKTEPQQYVTRLANAIDSARSKNSQAIGVLQQIIRYLEL